jgi:hypothetical protein
VKTNDKANGDLVPKDEPANTKKDSGVSSTTEGGDGDADDDVQGKLKISHQS